MKPKAPPTNDEARKKLAKAQSRELMREEERKRSVALALQKLRSEREQAAKQRDSRREMALRALAPGLGRCFTFWAEFSEREADSAARLPGLQLQLARTTRRRVLQRIVGRWRAAAGRWCVAPESARAPARQLNGRAPLA